MKYNAITQNSPSGGGWAKIFTMYQNYLGNMDWNENNLTFRVFQCGGEGYAEGTYFISTYRGSGSTDKIVFRDLSELFPAQIICRYIQHDNMIDVYAKSKYSGVPIKLQVLQTPVLGKIQFWDRIGFVANPVGTMVEPVSRGVTGAFGITYTNLSKTSNTYSDVAKELYMTKFDVHIRDVRGITSTTFTGSGQLATLPNNVLPTWAFTDTKTSTTFMQDYRFVSASNEISFGKYKFTIQNDGKVMISGLPSLANGGSINLFIDLVYRRN